MTRSEVFFGLINPLLQEHLNNLRLSSQEKLGMQVKIFDIFQRNEDLDDIYHELLGYLMDDLRLNPLVAELDKHYSKI